MALTDAWIAIGLSFVAGGFFGAAIQLLACIKSLDQLSPKDPPNATR